MTGDPDTGAPPRASPLQGLRDRLRSATGARAGDGAHAAPQRPTRESRPGRTRGRLSTAEGFTDVFEVLGEAATGSGRHVPLGRYLTWQAPAAGEMLDDALKDSIIDKRLLQPAVRAYDRLGIAAAVLGPPAVILAIERTGEQLRINPDGSIDHPLFPMLRTMIRRSLPTMVPAMKRAKAREDKVNAAVAEMWPDLPEGADPADAVLSMMFEGLRFVPPPAPEEPADERIAV